MEIKDEWIQKLLYVLMGLSGYILKWIFDKLNTRRQLYEDILIIKSKTMGQESMLNSVAEIKADVAVLKRIMDLRKKDVPIKFKDRRRKNEEKLQ